ncbi:unnamed protein product, partial [Brachionus calyciflorus]
YTNDLKNFNGQTLGSFKRSYPEYYEVLKNFLGKEIFIEDLVENLIRLISHFDSSVLSKEPNFYTNKKYDSIFQLVDVLSKDDVTVHNHKLSFCETYVFRNFKSKFLSFFNDKNVNSNELNSSQVSSQNNLESQEGNVNRNAANSEFYRVNNQIRSIYRNKIWTNFTVTMFNRHLEKGTTPAALFFDKFPKPYLSKDKDFVDEYNRIIEKTQKDIMNLCINSLSKRLDGMNNELKNIRDKLKTYFQEDELSKKFDEIESKEEYHLRPQMKKSMEKVNNIYAKKFEVIDRPVNDNSNFRDRVSSDNSFNSQKSIRRSNQQNRFRNYYSKRDYEMNSSYIKKSDRRRSNSNYRFRPRSYSSNFDNLSLSSKLLNVNTKIFFEKIKSKYHSYYINLNLNRNSCDSLDCFFKETRHKVDPTSIPLQKETIDFKFELYKNLLNLNYDLSFNLTKEQFKAMKRFIKDKPFRVVECDKNIGVALISYENYDKLAINHLNDKEFYLKIESDPLNDVKQCINSILRELCYRKDISKSLLKKLLIDTGQLGNFRILTKLHKAKFGIRPIISYKNSILSNLCLLIDLLLQPWVKNLESFIKDSQNLMQDLSERRFPTDSKIFSCDFESLYTNMGLVLALTIITE